MLISLKDTTKMENFNNLTLRFLWHVVKLRNIFIGIKYFEIFVIIRNIFYMAIWIYKGEKRVSIIEKITKLYIILHKKLHIEISLLWSNIDEYYNDKILKETFLNT